MYLQDVITALTDDYQPPTSVFHLFALFVLHHIYSITVMPTKMVMYSRTNMSLYLLHSISEFRCHIAGCKQFFDTLEGYEHHYNALHRNVCSICKRCFPSNRLLDVHILEWHDSLFQIMAEKQCMVMSYASGSALSNACCIEWCGHFMYNHIVVLDCVFN